MSLRDILNESTKLSGVAISDKVFIRWYNRCINKLGLWFDTAKTKSTQTIVCEDSNTEYDITSGTLKIDRVLDSSGYYYSGFKVRSNSKILFNDLDTYTIYATVLPSTVDDISDDITVNSIYSIAISQYVASIAIKETNPQESLSLMSEFNDSAIMANKNIRKADNPNRMVGVRRFR